MASTTNRPNDVLYVLIIRYNSQLQSIRVMYNICRVNYQTNLFKVRAVRLVTLENSCGHAAFIVVNVIIIIIIIVVLIVS